MSRILVVDDHAITCRELADLLKGIGHTSTIAHSGAEAISMIPRGAFDLVVLDLLMPGMDGWQVLKWIRSDEGMPAIPVIAHSELSDPRVIALAKQSGANDFWIKSNCSFDQICTSLERLLPTARRRAA